MVYQDTTISAEDIPTGLLLTLQTPTNGSFGYTVNLTGSSSTATVQIAGTESFTNGFNPANGANAYINVTTGSGATAAAAISCLSPVVAH